MYKFKEIFAEKQTFLKQQNENSCLEYSQQMLVQLFAELE
jgi:hypothetical protein